MRESTQYDIAGTSIQCCTYYNPTLLVYIHKYYCQPPVLIAHETILQSQKHFFKI